MLAINFSSSTHLLQSWKTLRSNLTSELIDYKHLENVVNFWAYCPISGRVLDWDRPDLWPDPWQLIHQNNFDECAISLGMFYTLLLSADGRWNSERLKLMILKNQQQQFQGVVLQIDDKWILNYEYNAIFNRSGLDTDTIIQQKYVYDNKHFVCSNLHSKRSYININVTGVN